MSSTPRGTKRAGGVRRAGALFGNVVGRWLVGSHCCLGGFAYAHLPMRGVAWVSVPSIFGEKSRRVYILRPHFSSTPSTLHPPPPAAAAANLVSSTLELCFAIRSDSAFRLAHRPPPPAPVLHVSFA